MLGYEQFLSCDGKGGVDSAEPWQPRGQVLDECEVSVWTFPLPLPNKTKGILLREEGDGVTVLPLDPPCLLKPFSSSVTTQ